MPCKKNPKNEYGQTDITPEHHYSSGTGCEVSCQILLTFRRELPLDQVIHVSFPTSFILEVDVFGADGEGA